MRRNSRGFSLLELSASMVAVGLLVTILFWMLLTSQALWVNSTASVRLQQDLCLGGGQRIARELRFSKATTLTNLTNETPSALSFASAFDGGDKFVTNNTTGDPVWQRQLVYYVKDGHLMRTEVTGSTALTPTQLRALVATARGRVMAESVDSMTLVGNCLTLGGTTLSRHGENNRQSVQFEVNPCN